MKYWKAPGEGQKCESERLLRLLANKRVRRSSD
jgi:hypothetical protein